MKRFRRFVIACIGAIAIGVLETAVPFWLALIGGAVLIILGEAALALTEQPDK